LERNISVLIWNAMGIRWTGSLSVSWPICWPSCAHPPIDGVNLLWRSPTDAIWVRANLTPFRTSWPEGKPRWPLQEPSGRTGEIFKIPDTQLAMQLTRLRKQMALGKMGKQMHVTIEASRKLNIRALKSRNLDVFQELVALTKMQRIRVQALWEKEIASNKPCQR
jgi:hypothetical protein